MSTYPATKKSFGQHWLYDEQSLDAVVQAAGIGPDDTVLEIGPGPGALTKKLVASAKQVIAVELDKKLANELPKRVSADNLTVVQQDIMKYDLSELSPGYKVVANIPYYLTSNLLRVLCENPNPFDKAAILMQKEVAERVCAGVGSMSLLSVSVQFYCQASMGRVVPAQLFTPPPKVHSQILKLKYRRTPLLADVNPKLFFSLVRTSFQKRRKMLLNSLSAGLGLSRETTLEILAVAGIDHATRPQNLSIDAWYDLYNATITVTKNN